MFLLRNFVFCKLTSTLGRLRKLAILLLNIPKQQKNLSSYCVSTTIASIDSTVVKRIQTDQEMQNFQQYFQIHNVVLIGYILQSVIIVHSLIFHNTASVHQVTLNSEECNNSDHFHIYMHSNML